MQKIKLNKLKKVIYKLEMLQSRAKDLDSLRRTSNNESESERIKRFIQYSRQESLRI